MADTRGDNNPATRNILVKALKMATKYDPLFILHSGDIVWTGKQDSFT